MPVIVIPRGLAKYLCVFLGSIFVILGLNIALNPPYERAFNLGVFIFAVGLANLVIGILDFRPVRELFMNWMRPMPIEQCPFCKERSAILFRDSLRTEAECIFCKARWRFHYNWWLSRKLKETELVRNPRPR